MSSKIEWTEDTWNPILGCDKVSAGCKNCYAIKTAWVRQHNPKMAERFSRLVSKSENGQLNWTGQINLIYKVLEKPLRTKKPTTYFVNSMSDIFHEKVPFWYIDTIFKIMHVCPQHTFQILTKREDRMLEYFQREDLLKHIDDADFELAKYGINTPDHELIVQPNGKNNWPLPNVWVGVSVEDQKAADERIPKLLRVPAAVRFLSMEPMLGPVVFDNRYLREWCPEHDMKSGGCTHSMHSDKSHFTKIDWVIVGGESGKGARPMHPEWVRSIRDQCKESGVPFFFKQWGEWYTRWVNLSDKSDHPFVFKYFDSYQEWTQKNWVKKGDACISIDGTWCKTGGDLQRCAYPVAIMNKVGKKQAGRLLDGQVHDEYPMVK